MLKMLKRTLTFELWDDFMGIAFFNHIFSEPTRICSIDAYQTCGRDALSKIYRIIFEIYFSYYLIHESNIY